MAQLIFSALPQPRNPMICINPDISVAECIDIMTLQNIGALVVMDKGELVGIVSERDVVRALYRGVDIKQALASEISYTNVSVLDIFDSIENAMETITRTKRRHILISEENELIAVLSIGDLLFHLLEDKTRVIEQLENYIHTY